MKREQLSDAFGMIDSGILEETDRVRSRGKRKRPVKWLAAAACLALVIFAGSRALPQEHDTDLPSHSYGDAGRPSQGEPTELPGEESTGQSQGESPKPSDLDGGQLPQENQEQELPRLTVDEWTGIDGAAIYMAYDISDLTDANPWNEATELSTLPVYKNRRTFDEENPVAILNADYDGMRALLLETAEKLGLDTDSLTIIDDAPDEETKKEITKKYDMSGEAVPDGCFNPYTLTAQADGISIDVDVDMVATITFEPAIVLPEEYSFPDISSCEDALALANYLKNEYRELIDMEHPVINIYGGDYDINREQHYRIAFYDAGENETEQIINYNFNQITFDCDDDGKLYLARIFRPNVSEKLGDYPIITTEEAEKLLRDGHYFTTVPYDLPDNFEISKTELIYRDGPAQSCFLPYYRFYIELTVPEEQEADGMKSYGAYDVPAVAPEYISNMPEQSS